MKVLVTGANGQVGFCLTKLLALTQWNFISFVREELDIGDAQAVADAVTKFRPNLIINAAAYTAVDKAESNAEDAYQVNSKGAENLAIAAQNVNAAIFHISTDYVFAGDLDQPYQEDSIVSPQSVYGLSKLKAEQLVACANPSHIILRTAWVFGEHGNNFVKTMLRLGGNRESLSIVNDQLGGPTYAGDIAETLLKIAREYEKNKDLPWGIYHFSGFPYVSWFEFAKAIFDEAADQHIYSKNIPLLNAINTIDYPTPARRPKNSRLNCDKIQKNFQVNMSNWALALKNIKGYV